MDQSVSLLVLISLCSFTMCLDYEYHFINESKTWEEAQAFCRANYTDLVTVNNMKHMTEICEGKNCCRSAWIGLYDKNNSNQHENRTWQWSLPGKMYNESQAQWDTGEPNDKDGKENCVSVTNNKWHDVNCCDQRTFICFNDTSTDNYTSVNYKVINEEKRTWLEAVQFCREHYTDLVSGLDQFNEAAAAVNITDKTRIGLFRDTWGWSDGSNSSFRNWNEAGNDNVVCDTPQQQKNCAKLGDDNKWMSVSCSEKNPFICSDDHMILIQQNMTWEKALFYCRQNHYDLVWITDEHLQRMVQNRAKKANTDFVWVGLFYSCFLETWVWGDGEWVVYNNWEEKGSNNCSVSGAMKKEGKWVKRPPGEKNNFVCFV